MEAAINQAKIEHHAFTILITTLQGTRYGVRYGIDNFPNVGGIWVP